MNLQRHLELGLTCFSDNTNLPRRMNPIKQDQNSSDLYSTCYFQLKTFDDSLENKQILIEPSKIPQALPLIRNNYNSCKSIKSRELQPISLLSSVMKKQQSVSQFQRLAQNKLGISSKSRQNLKVNDWKIRKQVGQLRKPVFVVDGLKKQQKYFQSRQVDISSQKIMNLGLCEAGNRFKTKNIVQIAQALKITANHIKFKPARLIGDIFMTNIQQNSQFLNDQLSKEAQHKLIVQKCEEEKIYTKLQQNQQHMVVTQNKEDNLPKKDQIQANHYLTFSQYQVVQDQQFKMFKTKHITYWGDIKLSLAKITQCLRYHKVGYIRVKEAVLLLWHGKKTTFQQIALSLTLPIQKNINHKIQTICMALRDRMKVKKIRNQIKKKQNLARWVIQRLKTKKLIRNKKIEKIKTAQNLHKQLKQNMQWDVQIYLPSFSVQQFKRNSTQYMQSFENLYHSIWQQSDKHLVIVLPTLNQNLLALMQTRLKIKRTLTIVCPQIYQSFPTNLPLAAYIYFSHQTLTKIATAVNGRQAVIIPSISQNLNYEMLISQYLNIPLLCSLDLCNNIAEQRSFFSDVGICNPSYQIIQPLSSYQEILDKFAIILSQNEQQKTWILKINQEFRGRGIATVKLNPQKYCLDAKNKLEIQQIKKYLRKQLKLKLKVNFQNSLFNVDEFLKQFQKKGGVIQQMMTQTQQTYELCFSNMKTCQFLMAYRLYGVNFSNKVWITTSPTPAIRSTIDRLKKHFSQQYLGFVTVTICQTSLDQIIGIDIKLGFTYSSSVVPLLKSLNSFHNDTGNLNTLRTLRQQTPRLQQSFNYVLIPNLVFTDLDQIDKAKLIEDLMQKCWMNRHLNFHQQNQIFMSCGIDFSVILMGQDLKRLKKRAIELIRDLADRVSTQKQYRGKQVVRDVFQYGDIVRALTQIKVQ